MVGAAGFEPATSCSQGRRANQAALRPEPFRKIEDLTYHLRLFGVKEKGCVCTVKELKFFAAKVLTNYILFTIEPAFNTVPR